MKSVLLANGLIELDASGNFTRIGDYAAMPAADALPFSFHADANCAFAPVRGDGRGNRRKMLYRNADGSVEIIVNLEYDEECGILSRRDCVRNSGGEALMLRRYLSRFGLNCGEYEVASQRSFWCRESEESWNPLHTGRLDLFSREGRWCESATPFAALRDKYASHALAFLVFPAGDWLLRFAAAEQDGRMPGMTVDAGLTDERLELEIAPGEEWEAPEVLMQLLPTRESYSGSALMHRYLNRRFPLRPGHQHVIYNTWLDRMNNLDTERLEKQLDAAKRCGCEVFVVDYGWYEDYATFTRVDNWTECSDRAFHGRMKHFADKVRSAGLGFGFWVEFEFFAARSKVVQEHPDWFFPSSHPGIVVPKSWLPEVEDMLVKSLTRTIRKYGAVFVKNDMNHSQGYEPSRLYRYQQGLTRVMTRLRKMLPEVTFENCSSGAMRAAAGPMLQNFDTQFISDNASPLDNLRMVAGAVNRMPVGRISHWYVASELHHANQSSMANGCVVQPQSATWDSFQSHDIHFGLIATLTGIPGFSCDLTSFSDENIGVIAKYVDFYKKYRHLLLTAEAQLLTPPENFDKKRGWFAMQLHAREAATHFCYFFHNVCDGDARRFFHLQGLEPHKKYRIRQLFPEEKTLLENTPGNELMHTGLEVQFQYNQHQGFRAELIIAEEQITESDRI